MVTFGARVPLPQIQPSVCASLASDTCSSTVSRAVGVQRSNSTSSDPGFSR